MCMKSELKQNILIDLLMNILYFNKMRKILNFANIVIEFEVEMGLKLSKTFIKLHLLLNYLRSKYSQYME
jgi:hypothetical protein